MARTPFPVEVVTPEGVVFSEDVVQVSTRTTLGLIGILANHQPLLGHLEPTELRLYRDESEIVRYAQAEGYLQVAEGRVLVLVSEAVPPESLDAGELRERVRLAESELEASDEGTEAFAKAARDKRRAEAFLALVER